MPILTLVACGAPLASRVDDVRRELQSAGWQVDVQLTQAATAWLSNAEPADFRSPDEVKPPRPDAVVICPLTFNTGNKLALGIADTQPLSLCAEALGAGKPFAVVPFVNESLWGHPAWSDRLAALTKAGVRMVDPQSGQAHVLPLASGTGDDVVRRFDPRWVVAALAG